MAVHSFIMAYACGKYNEQTACTRTHAVVTSRFYNAITPPYFFAIHGTKDFVFFFNIVFSKPFTTNYWNLSKYWHTQCSVKKYLSHCRPQTSFFGAGRNTIIYILYHGIQGDPLQCLHSYYFKIVNYSEKLIFFIVVIF